MASRRVFQLFAATGGLIAWALQFTVLYGVTSVICARGHGGATWFGIGIVPLTIVAATAFALAATGSVLVRALSARRHMDEASDPTDRFLNYTTIFVGGLSVVTILWHGLPAFIVPACS